jgi:uncharacterized membrane protein YphA (DoxX/SURF4 family)
MSFDSSQGGPLVRFIGVIPMRLVAGIALLYMHGWTEGLAGWQHLWNQAPWESIAVLEKAALPWPKALAVAAAGITAFTGASWILGFATRFASFIFLPVALGALLVSNRTEQSYAAESCVLYFLIALTLLVNGSGWFSVDAIFNAMRKGGGKKKSLYD